METTPALNDYEAHYAERRLLTLGAAFGRDPHLETRMLQSKARMQSEAAAGVSGSVPVLKRVAGGV